MSGAAAPCDSGVASFPALHVNLLSLFLLASRISGLPSHLVCSAARHSGQAAHLCAAVCELGEAWLTVALTAGDPAEASAFLQAAPSLAHKLQGAESQLLLLATRGGAAAPTTLTDRLAALRERVAVAARRLQGGVSF